MTRLQRCLGKLSKILSKPDADLLTKEAAAYERDGMNALEAARTATQDAIEDVGEIYASMLESARKDAPAAVPMLEAYWNDSPLPLSTLPASHHTLARQLAEAGIRTEEEITEAIGQQSAAWSKPLAAWIEANPAPKKEAPQAEAESEEEKVTKKDAPYVAAGVPTIWGSIKKFPKTLQPWIAYLRKQQTTNEQRSNKEPGISSKRIIESLKAIELLKKPEVAKLLLDFNNGGLGASNAPGQYVFNSIEEQEAQAEIIEAIQKFLGDQRDGRRLNPIIGDSRPLSDYIAESLIPQVVEKAKRMRGEGFELNNSDTLDSWINAIGRETRNAPVKGRPANHEFSNYLSSKDLRKHFDVHRKSDKTWMQLTRAEWEEKIKAFLTKKGTTAAEAYKEYADPTRDWQSKADESVMEAVDILHQIGHFLDEAPAPPAPKIDVMQFTEHELRQKWWDSLTTAQRADKIKAAGIKKLSPMMKFRFLISEQIEALDHLRPTEFRKPESAMKDPVTESMPTGAIGKNRYGDALYEDAHGARYYLDNGFQITQPVGIVPGVGAVIDGPRALYDMGRNRFVTEAEMARFKKEAEEEDKASTPILSNQEWALRNMEELSKIRLRLLDDTAAEEIVIQSLRNTPSAALPTVLHSMRNTLVNYMKGGVIPPQAYNYFIKHIENEQWFDKAIDDLRERVVPKEAPPSPDRIHGTLHEAGGRFYIDTKAIDTINQIAGNKVDHIGYGEFEIKTPNGVVDIIRLDGQKFEGQIGRAHELQGDPKTVAALVEAMKGTGVFQSGGQSQKSAIKVGDAVEVITKSGETITGTVDSITKDENGDPLYILDNEWTGTPENTTKQEKAAPAPKPLPKKLPAAAPKLTAAEELARKAIEGLFAAGAPDPRDDQYLTAVARGDMRKATEMVRTAAAESGLPIIDDSASEAFRVRRTAPPKVKVKAYKLFATKPGAPGEVFPLFVGANDLIPKGVWLDAIEGQEHNPGGSDRQKVKSKLGPLAYRPGWHAGDAPLATHIGVKNAAGEVFARRANEVWAEVEVAADVDYQEQADANGKTKSGFNAALADIKEMPKNGMYRYKTNPNMTGRWIISGSMKVVRVLSESEVNAVLKAEGLKPMPWQNGELDLNELGLTNNPAVNRYKLAEVTIDPFTGKVIPLSQRFRKDSVSPLYAAGTPEVYDAEIPGDRFMPMMAAAQAFVSEGVKTPAQLAQSMLRLAPERKAVKFSQKFWFALKTVGVPGETEPDWSAVYRGIDKPGIEDDGTGDEAEPATDREDEAPSDGVESGTRKPVAPKRGGKKAGAGDSEQLPENGEDPDESGNPGTMGGNAPRPDVDSEGSQPKSGDGSKRGGKRSPEGSDSEQSGDGSGVDGSNDDARKGYRLTDPKIIIGTSNGPKARFARNRLALETYDRVFSENRAPTPEEQDIMAAYIGWGSFGQELFQGTWERPNPQPKWETESDWLRDHLGKDGWQSINESIINAHYTDPPHVAALWRIAQHLGFKGGRTLEPSMGIGTFFGMMPDVIRAKSKLTGIELDRVVGGMAKMLYPDANIRIMGYEESKTADNFYDLIIGNWPFAKEGPSDVRYNTFGLSMHNYFFVKALDQVRPGGLVIGITSKGSMDTKGMVGRRQMAKRAKLVSAFRFPTGAFDEYAGTKVVTDVLIFQKHQTPQVVDDSIGWLKLEEYGQGRETFFANEYWRTHPDHILGEMTYGHGTTQFKAGMIVKRPDDYQERLARIEQMLPADIMTEREVETTPTFQNRAEKADQNSVLWEDGTGGTPAGFYIVRGEQLEPLEKMFTWKVKDKKKTEKRQSELKHLIRIRESVNELLRAQREGNPDTETIRKATKDLYDSFVKAYGPIAEATMTKALVKANDPMALALENLERFENGKYVPRDILTKDIMRRPTVDARGSIEDAFAIQRNASTTLDIDEIARLSEKTPKEVITKLVGMDLIYKMPDGKWESGEEYLGGNVRRKLREAKDAKEQGLDMDRNIKALEAIQPKDVAYFEIEVQMGASWITKDDYLSYASHLMATDAEQREKDFALSRGSSGWNFKLLNKSIARSAEARELWGNPYIHWNKIFQAAMNGQQVKIYEKDADGVSFLNDEATKLANGKIDAIREELANWLWSDQQRAGRIAENYNEMMNSEVVPKRNGSHLRFEGLALTMGNSEFDFRQHQKDAVWRGIMDGQMMAAHEVGTGKTFTMAGLAVEGRRLGKFRKSIVFAHNANAESVYRDFQAAYPGGKFLFLDSLNPTNRENAMRQIANDEWDAVIVPHSLIDRFSLREETLMALAAKQIQQLEEEIANELEELGIRTDIDLDDDKAVGKAFKFQKDIHRAKELVNMRKRIIKRIKEKAANAIKEKGVYFEDLGIDTVMVDEAHMFKKIALATRKEVKGLNKTESERGWMLGAITDTVKSKNNGKGVFLFTGTPLTNNLNEAFNMMRFVMDEAMAEGGINSFDDWFNSFAAAVSDVELTTGGTFEPVSRLLAFVNVPELARMAARYFDVVQAKSMPEFVPRDSPDGQTPGGLGRPFKVMRSVTAEMSPQQKANKRSIQRRYKAFQALDGKSKRAAMLNGKDTPIQLETEGIKAALDMRLVDRSADDFAGSKGNLLVENAMMHYDEHPRSTQMIFLERGFNDFTDSNKAVKDDNGNPIIDDEGKKVKVKIRVRQFNVIRDMVEKLVARGVRPEEIAVFSDMKLDPIANRPDDVLRKVQRVSAANTKEDLAAMMREGKIRFAFGSTQTMGTGVNAQDEMRAMHHLDAPWTPGEFEQRNGRGHRQGNKWNTVYEYRYFTESSHDGRRWQVLLNKVKFISRFTEMLLSAGGEGLRVLAGDGADLNEEGSDVANFEQSFSTAAGDPRILVRAKLNGDVEKLERRKDTHFQSITRGRSTIEELKREKIRLEKTIRGIKKVLSDWNAEKEKGFSFTITPHRKVGQEPKPRTFTNRKEAEEFLAALPSYTKSDDKLEIGEYNGGTITHHWQDWGDGESTFRITLPTGEEKGFWGDDDKMVIGVQLSLPSIEGSVRGKARSLEDRIEEHGKIDGSVASLEEMMSKPFSREAELETKKAALEQIEAELKASPEPAPSWLRNGAPVGSLVYLADGKAYDVAAHRWDDNGWWVLIENEDGMQPVDYRKVFDENETRIFEDVEFRKPAKNDPKQLDDFDDEADDDYNPPEEEEIDDEAEPDMPKRTFAPLGQIAKMLKVNNAPMAGWLFGMERKRTADGKLATLRRIEARLAPKLEELQSFEERSLNKEEKARLKQLERTAAAVGKQIAKAEKSKMADAKIGKPTPLRAAGAPQPADPFYSQLQRVLESKLPKSATIDQVLQIANNDAKAEEVKWSGLAPALREMAVDGKVSKADVLNYLRTEGSVEFVEVVHGSTGRSASRVLEELDGMGYTASEDNGDWYIEDSEGYNVDFDQIPERAQNLLRELEGMTGDDDRLVDDSGTQYGKYTIPGGSNYTEMVLTMPQEGESSYTSTHFSKIPNYVAHMRTADHDAGLLIEEIQSDRHQEGRKKGYNTDPVTKLPPGQTLKNSGSDWWVENADGTMINPFRRPSRAEAIGEALHGRSTAETMLRNVEAGEVGVADAPFRTTWPLALFKRALRDAVARKKAWIGWTGGDTQADRYDLSKQIEKIDWTTTKGGKRDVWIEPKESTGFSFFVRPDGTVYTSSGEEMARMIPENALLSDVIGKDIAEMIMAQTEGELEGEGLRIGNQGMKGFYDEILPKMIGKYIGPMGGKVEKASIESGEAKIPSWDAWHRQVYGQDVDATLDDETIEARHKQWEKLRDTPETTRIWKIQITPKMEAAVNAGQPLFAAGAPTPAGSPKPAGDVFRRATPVSKPLADEARAQQKAFGQNVASGKLAGFGNQKSRDEQDVVDAIYEFQKRTKTNADTMAIARARLAKDPADIEAKLLDAVTDKVFALDAADHLAMQMLINQKSEEAGSNQSLHAENMARRMAYRLMRGDAARTLQIGFDRLMTPAERAQAAITDAIYTPTKKVEKVAMGKPIAERAAFFKAAAEARVATVQAELDKLGVTLAEVTGKVVKLELANSQMMQDVAKLRKQIDRDVIKMVQGGASMADIKRRYGMTPDEVNQIIDAVRTELSAKIAPLVAAGMTIEDIVKKLGPLSAAGAPAPAGAKLTQAQINAQVAIVLQLGFGIPPVNGIPAVGLPKPRAPKTPPPPTSPMLADWSRPDFADGLRSWTFDRKDRAGIMARVEHIRSIAGALGKIDGLTGTIRAEAEAKLAEIEAILAKYGTDAASIFSSGKPIEDYRFNIADINHVSAVARAISAIDADWIDKATEVVYANMLSGLQTMMVNATAILPVFWETTVGRGMELAINAVVRDPMSAQFGEVKYILKAIKPALLRAMSNFSASFQAQHPMFDRDVLNREVDWDKILGGAGYRAGGSISGKKGNIIRIPMRILASTDDFNRTLMACVEVGCFAYRIGLKKSKTKNDPLFGKGPGTPEFDRFLKTEVNKPGSTSYMLAAQRASRAIFSNALPGQNDATTGEKVEVNDLGDMVGWAAASLNKFVSQEHDNLFAKASLAALRVCFFPFQRTPFNILRKGVRYTLNPFSMFDIGLGVILNSKTTDATGATKWKWNANGRNPELVERLGQQLQGAIVMLMLAAMAAGEGDDDDQNKSVIITGSSPFTPQGRAEREAQARSGIPGYRISFRKADGTERVGFSYGRLEPMATTLAATIDMMKAVKRANAADAGLYDAAANALGGLAAQAQDKSFMRGIGDLVGLITNLMAQPDLQENRKFQQFLAGRVAMVIPNILKQPLREADDVYRERATSFMQEVLYSVAPYGQKEAKVDPYGRIAEKTGNPVVRIVDVSDAGTDKVHPVDRMLLRWRDSGKWAKAPDPSDRKAWFPAPIVNADFRNPVTGKTEKMTAAQLSEFRTMSGKLTDQMLKAEKLNFDNPTALDVDIVKKTVTAARSKAKQALSYKFARQK